MIEWFSPRELAVLQLGDTANEKQITGTVRAINARAKRESWKDRKNTLGQPLAVRRQGKGGGWQYHYSLLSSIDQVKLLRRLGVKAEQANTEVTKEAMSRDERWAWYADIPDKKKRKAEVRLSILDQVQTLVSGGMGKAVAVEEVAAITKVHSDTIYRWFKEVRGLDRTDWLPYLAPKHIGRTAIEEIDARVWEWIRSDYLRLEKPTMTSCYRRLERVATKEGWPLPTKRTVERRIGEIPTTVRTLAREGVEALKRLYPAQERDRSVFHAMQAVNADGHKFDVWVRWPGEDKPIRVMMVAIQDLYSGKILSWRIDKSENKEAVLLTFGDMIETFGIPEYVYLDNGKSFASKWITGGTAHRFRFKVKDEDPSGLLHNLGCKVIWTTPYSGQSKPIERAFKGFCDDIAKHPSFAGCWTGNTIENKPENYGSRAVDLDTFIEVVADGVVEHNARIGRRTKVCNGKSFDQVFTESYARSPITKATEVHRRLWLLAAENVKVRKNDATIHLLDNRFWNEALIEVQGHQVTARFDPDDLHAGLHIYRQDGAYICFAECIEAAGFNDVTAAREHSKARRSFLKAAREMLDAERRLNPDQLAEMIPAQTAAPLPDSKVVKPVFDAKVMTPPPPEPAPEMTEEELERADQKFAELTGANDEEATNVVALHTEPARPVFDNDIEFVEWTLTSEKATDDDKERAAALLKQSTALRLAIGAD